MLDQETSILESVLITLVILFSVGRDEKYSIFKQKKLIATERAEVQNTYANTIYIVLKLSIYPIYAQSRH